MFEDDPKYKILIIDDGLLNQFVLDKILGDIYTLKKAYTAKEALEIVHQFRPHLILLDIILPDASGFDVLTTLNEMEDTHDIPVIVCTGLDSDADEEKGFTLGAVDYIKKPFKDAIVLARVNTQIRIIKQMRTIEQLGLIDALTEISNRRAFDNQIQYEWRRSIREKGEISMLMLDIDKFKNFNDTYGHRQGDRMLQLVAKALKNSLKRSTDLLFRYGGEEFAVILPGTGLDGAVAVAELLRKAIAKMEVPCPSAHTMNKATVSIGVASMLPEVSDHLSDLVEKSDQMLYQAKINGRNRVEFEISEQDSSRKARA